MFFLSKNVANLRYGLQLFLDNFFTSNFSQKKAQNFNGVIFKKVGILFKLKNWELKKIAKIILLEKKIF